MKTDLFQSCGHYWVFQICWHIECSTFTASSFRIWNSSSGFPAPPLALLVVMVPKAHLTSHSRMSGSRWVIIPSWLSELWSFLYSSSVHSCCCCCCLLSHFSHAHILATPWTAAYQAPPSMGFSRQEDWSGLPLPSPVLLLPLIIFCFC